MKEEFKSKWNFDGRFHIYFNNRYSLIMLSPEYYGYMYELYDLKKEEIIDRFDSLVKAITRIKYLLKIGVKYA